MGATESKEENKKYELFSAEEKEALQSNFFKLSGGQQKTDRLSVERALREQLDLPELENLPHRLCSLMTGRISLTNTVTLEGYAHCCRIMLKGMLEEKASLISYLANGSHSPPSLNDCYLFARQVIFHCFQTFKNTPAFRSWDGNFMRKVDKDSIDRLADSLIRVINKEDRGETCDEQTICHWLTHSNIFYELFSIMAHQIFHFPIGKEKQLVPLCRGLPSRVYPSWLTLADILFINVALPIELRSEWRFLFSSRIHGESFSSLMGSIIDKGPSVIFIQDTDGHIFGGFASTSWTISPQFTGSNKNFVFRLSPDMAIYNTTGFNDHYQYLNIQQQTFPNGLGMGGQLEYFGIWIDAEYGKGKCSPTCTTYACQQLSKNPEFLIDRIEVWAVGPEPVKDEDESEPRPSILDVDVEGKAMLKMLNRGPLSEGMRETPTSDEPEEKQLYVTMPE